MQANPRTSRSPWLEGTVSYTEIESVLSGTPIKLEPLAEDFFLTSPSPTRPTSQAPQPPPTGHIPAGLASASRPPQRKRKRDVGAGDGKETGEEKPPAHKRRRNARLETLSEEQQGDARGGRQSEHEQPPVQVQPRRSTRIQARNKKDAALPKIENPAKPASRKRTVRKK